MYLSISAAIKLSIRKSKLHTTQNYRESTTHFLTLVNIYRTSITRKYVRYMMLVFKNSYNGNYTLKKTPHLFFNTIEVSSSRKLRDYLNHLEHYG